MIVIIPSPFLSAAPAPTAAPSLTQQHEVKVAATAQRLLPPPLDLSKLAPEDKAISPPPQPKVNAVDLEVLPYQGKPKRPTPPKKFTFSYRDRGASKMLCALIAWAEKL